MMGMHWDGVVTMRVQSSSTHGCISYGNTGCSCLVADVAIAAMYMCDEGGFASRIPTLLHTHPYPLPFLLPLLLHRKHSSQLYSYQGKDSLPLHRMLSVLAAYAILSPAVTMIVGGSYAGYIPVGR